MYPRQNHIWLPLLHFIIPFAFLYLGLVQSAFQTLGLSPAGALFFLIASLVGGMMNIPLNRQNIVIVGGAGVFDGIFLTAVVAAFLV